MPVALLVEIEELLFDTRAMRARALHAALVAEGIPAMWDDVFAAHAGVAANIALQLLPAARALDDVGRDLVLRRADDAVATSLAGGAPSFDPLVQRAIEALAAEFPLAAVTRATRSDAQRLLELAGLEACFTAVRSLACVSRDDHRAVWANALSRTRAAKGVALAPGALLGGAAHESLRMVQVGDGPDVPGAARLASLTSVNTLFIASLF